MERDMRSIVPAALVVSLFSLGISQVKDDLEYGIGYLDAAYAGGDSLALYQKPSVASKPAAFLQSNKIRFSGELRWVSAYPRCIEVVPREVYGVPILGFSSDSQWVEVSLDCRMLVNPPVAWVWRANPLIHAGLWGGSWQVGCPLHFRESATPAFFDGAFGRPVNIAKALPEFNPADYCMRLLEIRGKWMKVLIQTPTPPLGEDDEVHPSSAVKTFQAEAWIQFLEENGRPRVWPIYDE